MLAGQSRRPFDSHDHVFEPKWDGIRALAFVQDGVVRLQSRNLRNITPQFPEVAELPTHLKVDGVVLDGELVCLDEHGRQSFSRIQQRFHMARRGTGEPVLPAQFTPFDVLYQHGKSVMERPLLERKALLNEVLEPSDGVQICEFVENDGLAFFQAALNVGLEGMVAKQKSGLYYPGRRSSDWLKIKDVKSCDFVIGGYAYGGKQRLFSSVLLGLYDDQSRPLFVGQAGSGFSQSEIEAVHGALKTIETSGSPFANRLQTTQPVRWSEPLLVCRVEYTEFTDDGLLRHPAFQSMQIGKPPAECTTEQAPGWRVPR